MLAVIYTFGISVVAGILFVAVNEFEPDRLLALALKFVIVFVGVAAVAGRLTQSSADWGRCPGLKVRGRSWRGCRHFFTNGGLYRLGGTAPRIVTLTCLDPPGGSRQFLFWRSGNWGAVTKRKPQAVYACLGVGGVCFS